MKKRDWIFLILILAIGFFFRFYLIKEMPGGLFPDEAANGLDINNIFKGHLLPFFMRGNGREALFFYLEAFSVLIFGHGVWQFHIVSATMGLASVFTTFLLVKRLYGKTEALVSAYLMAIGSWAVVISRTAFRANLIPFFATITLYFFVRIIQAKTNKDRLWSAIFAGAFFAGGFYSYIAYRIMAVILLFIIAILVIADRKQSFVWVKQYWRSFLVGIAAFIVVFAPLGIYFIQNPGTFVGRAGQVSIFNPELNGGHLGATLLSVSKKSLLAYFTVGDANWRQNISMAPFLSPLISPFFGLSLLILSWFTLKFIWQCFSNRQNNNHLRHLPLIGLFWGMLIPEISTAEGIPHGLRSIGTLAPAYALAAIGLVYFARLALKLWHPHWMEKAYFLVAAVFFVSLAMLTYSQYFVYAYNTPANFDAFRSDLTTVSSYLNQNPDKNRNFLVLDLYSEQTTDYLTSQTNNPYQIVDPANSDKLHLQKGDRIIFTASTLFDMNRFLPNHKNLKLVVDAHNKFDTSDMIVFEATTDDSSNSSAHNADGSFYALNLGDQIYFSWQNISFDPWVIKIWQCPDASCKDATLLKTNNQNDYFANNDHIDIQGKQNSDSYFEAIGYNSAGQTIKDYGIIDVPQYK